MSITSVLRLRAHMLRERRGRLRQGKMLVLNIKSPFRAKIALREVGSDVTTLEEVVYQEVYGSVTRHIPDLRTVIDLGANIGLATLCFAESCAACRIFAVEPHPDTYRVLERNVRRLTRSGRCTTLRAAVWKAHRTLYGVPRRQSERFSSFAVAEGSPTGGEPEVEGYTMPELLERAGFQRVDLLKVDIEGAEIELFKGELDWLARVRSIAIEFHKGAREPSGFNDIMNDRGFQVLEEGNHTVFAVNRRQ
jgi:FkbM family methyltransferase